MLATGGLLLSLALLTLALLAPIFQRSDPPRWTRIGWLGEIVTVAIVCVLALGLVYLGAGAVQAVRTGPHALDLGLLAVVAAAAVLIWRRLKARGPRAPAAPAASLEVAVPAPATAPPQPPAVAAGDPPPHKAA